MCTRSIIAPARGDFDLSCVVTAVTEFERDEVAQEYSQYATMSTCQIWVGWRLETAVEKQAF